MANEFSVTIHDFISARIAAGTRKKADAENADDRASVRYYEGWLQELMVIRQYMADNIDLKTQKYF